MARRLRNVMIFLLIILKELNTQEAGCSCAPRQWCHCLNLGLIDIPSVQTSIYELNLKGNQITRIPSGAFVDMTRLVALDLSNNQIAMIQSGSFANLHQLTKLYLSHNKITKIQSGTFAGLNRLVMLCLSSNEIKIIQSGAFADLPQLSELSLSSNQIEMIRSGGFTKLARCRKLSLPDNKITNIQPGVFANLPRLEELYLYSNQITSVQPGSLANLPRLQILDLTKNLITMIQAGVFANLPTFTRLTLTRNQITMIQPGVFENLPMFRTLDLSSNNIKKICPLAFANLPWLQVLQMSSNQITMIQSGALKDLPRLKNLILSRNKIATIHPGAFANLSEFKTLHITYNRMTIIQASVFKNLPRLQELYLSFNQISIIQSGAFSNLPLLQTLELERNQITNIHSGAFEKLPQLQKLNLRSNRISTILPSDYGFLQSVLTIKLDRNVWNCDCRMAPFRRNIAEFPSFKDQIICVWPAKFRRQKLIDVHSEGMICEEAPTLPPPVDIQPSGPLPAVPTTGSFCNLGSTGSPVSLSVDIQTSGPFTSSAAPSSLSNTETVASPTTRLQTGPFTSSEVPSSLSNTEYVASPTTRPLSSTLPLVSLSGSTNTCYSGSIASRYHWHFITNASSTVGSASVTNKTRATQTLPLTTDKPERSSFPQAFLIFSVCGPIAGIILIGTIVLTPWYKGRTSNPPLKPNPTVVGSNTNTVASVVSNDNGNQCYSIDNDHDQTGHGQLQANTRSVSVEVGNLSHNEILAALKPNAMYAGEETQPRDQIPTEMASSHDHDKTGKGQSQAITESNITAIAMTSGHDRQYENINQHHQTGHSLESQTNTESNTNTTAIAMASGQNHQYENMNQHNQTGQGESRVMTAAVTIIGHGQAECQAITDNTEPIPPNSKLNDLYNVVGQYQPIIKSNINTTTVVATSGHEQTGQGQYQAIYESFEAGNPSIGTGQGGAQATADECLGSRNQIYNTEPAALAPNPTYMCNDQTG
ncbi:uncharacterized protein LOC118418786 [Branchiostoma floridae]|uniref:Uncharacterized protein LOC118418786 n=1 Tax=Branchiostoma floridae TaxID=7739 RepID=A0A9J7MTP3_BRAFL|nr:uncharacterized protein LOC118418786 [Branchiostoma floridae]